MVNHNVYVLAAATLCGAVSLSAESFAGADRSADDLKARAEAMFDEVVARYNALETYSDVANVEFEIEVDEDADFFGGMERTQEFKLALAAPNRMAFENEQLNIFCDGNKTWLYLPMFGQYIERDAPSSWADVLLDGNDSMMLLMHAMGHPVLSAITREDERAEDYRSELVEIFAIEQVERNGKPGTLIRGTLESPQFRMMAEEPIPFEYWIDGATGLVGEVMFDMTEVYNQFARQMADMRFDDEDEDEDDMFGGMAMPTYEKFRTIVRLHDVHINEEIPAERFVFTPDDGVEKVDDFAFPGSRASSQYVLIGETAPDFTLPTLDEEDLTLSDLRGQVVLLDFWALWCGPCVQALPHIQKLADRFEGKPVTVLGVNRDPAGSEDRIIRMLERREITFGPHVLDIDGEVAESYHVRGIPCTVLIDQNGIVQDVGVGFHPGKVDELSEKIEKLLAGEQLHTPEEIAEMRARAEEDDQDDVEFFLGNRRAQRELQDTLVEALGEPLRGGRLEPLALHRSVRSQAWHLRLLDVDGDGGQKAVVPHQRGLRVIDLHDRSVEDISLSGMPSGYSVQAFDLVRIGGEPRWIVAAIRQGMWGATRGGMVSMYSNDGEMLWSFEPDLPRDLSVSYMYPVAADLTGDGRAEIAITMQAMRMGERRGGMMPSAQVAKIIVFSAEGDLLALHSGGMYVHAMHVVDSDLPDGARQTILCISDGRALWLEYSEATEELSLRP